jgi:hypothetical protein
VSSSTVLLPVYIARVCKGLISCSTMYLHIATSEACTIAKCCFSFNATRVSHVRTVAVLVSVCLSERKYVCHW